MRVLGIDPGLSGAAAVLESGAAGRVWSLVDAIDLPTFTPSRFSDAQRRIDVPAFCAWLARMAPDVAIVELVGAMTRQHDDAREEFRGMGATSAMKFGRAVGAIEAAIIGSGVRIEWVVPQSWKRHFGLKGPDKEQSRALALVYWGAPGPDGANTHRLLARKKDHQRAEAALIALWHVDKGGLLAAG